MPRFLLDTDHLSLYEHNHPPLVRRVLACSPGEIGVSAVSVEEALRGRLATLSRRLTSPQRVQAYAYLVGTYQLLQRFPIVSFDLACENRFQQLRSVGLRIGTRDLRIAAVTLENNLVLLTRNRRDFARIPGIALDDWST